MVHRPPKPSTTLAWIIAAFLVSLIIISGIKIISSVKELDTPVSPPAKITYDTPTPSAPKKPDYINLQPVVDQWAASVGGNAGVYIYDLDNDKEAASYNSDSIFATASVYKLFFVYEGYYRIDQGLDDPNEYFTDGKTRLECLDLIIRESYNPCADRLKVELDQEIDDIISKKYKIKDTSDYALYASAKAVAKMLKIYYHHEDLSEDSWSKIADSMLNQPVTTYDWRQGLPSGFSTAKVYNKVGWNYDEDHWEIYNDAAIVEFPEKDRHYVVVVLSRNTSNKKIAELGRLIEETVVNQ